MQCKMWLKIIPPDISWIQWILGIFCGRIPQSDLRLQLGLKYGSLRKAWNEAQIYAKILEQSGF